MNLAGYTTSRSMARRAEFEAPSRSRVGRVGGHSSRQNRRAVLCASPAEERGLHYLAVSYACPFIRLLCKQPARCGRSAPYRQTFPQANSLNTRPKINSADSPRFPHRSNWRCNAEGSPQLSALSDQLGYLWAPTVSS